MQIAYLTETYPPDLSSDALTASRTVAHLRAAGHAVQLIRPRRPGETALQTASEWRCSRWTPAGSFRELWRRRGAPDVLHVATAGPLAWSALRAAQQLGVPASADCRDAAPNWWSRLWWQRVHRMADGNFALTTEAADVLSRQGVERLSVTGRGVDTAQFSPTWRDPWLRRQWGAADSDAVLIWVGSITADSHLALALRTFERLRRKRPGLRMVVVGDGPQRQKLQNRHPRAVFAGTQRGPELARHFASADLLFFSSLAPGFGHVVLEAMASALVVVGLSEGAARQHVVNGYSGWLAGAADDPAAAMASLGAKIEQALDDAEPGSLLRRQARAAARVAEWPQVLHRFEQALMATAAVPPADKLVERMA